MTPRPSSARPRSSKPAAKPTAPDDRQAFNNIVFDIVRAIPSGRVMTYGAIARLIPAPSSVDPLAYRRVRARWVGYAMADCPDDVPWQRVVNAKGKVSPRPGHGPPVQRILLEEEGAVFDRDGALDLADLAWLPTDSWLTRRGLLADGEDQPN